MAVVHEPIKDRRSASRWLAEVRVPGIDRQLADEDRGARGNAVVEDLEQGPARSCVVSAVSPQSSSTRIEAFSMRFSNRR